MQTYIYVKTRFVHFHRWPDAPEQYAYLAQLHRHEFHVQLMVPVIELNREIEFIELKRVLTDFIGHHAISSFKEATLRKDDVTLTWSCEQWCQFLLERFPNAAFCSVSEDGENGAIMARTPEEVMEAMRVARRDVSPEPTASWE